MRVSSFAIMARCVAIVILPPDGEFASSVQLSSCRVASILHFRSCAVKGKEPLRFQRLRAEAAVEGFGLALWVGCPAVEIERDTVNVSTEIKILGLRSSSDGKGFQTLSDGTPRVPRTRFTRAVEQC
jgi:hypothetical protein